jgi:prepilin-type N-terminal cleavage/methylation domain-containing protein
MKSQKGSLFIKMYSACIKRNPEYSKGFTLIELLVVIAIIGILSSVVLASLNSARTKGQIAAIKSNLKNMISQAELAYSNVGNYSTACTSVDNMRVAINNNGGTAFCSSVDNTRWAVSAKLNSDTTKNWAVDEKGVVTWDTADAVGLKTWFTANDYCTGLGARLPSVEQLRALWLAYGSVAPPSFITLYWASNINPSDSAVAYIVNMSNGGILLPNKSNNNYARCVR